MKYGQTVNNARSKPADGPISMHPVPARACRYELQLISITQFMRTQTFALMLNIYRPTLRLNAFALQPLEAAAAAATAAATMMN